jgi:hypothetical protein
MVGVVLAIVAISVSIASAWFAREQVRLARRQSTRDFGATVLIRGHRVTRTDEDYLYELTLVNAGPAAARDVTVDLVEWSDEREGLGRAVDREDAVALLQRGEEWGALLRLPISAARFHDRTVAYEIGADYYDDNGVRNERLALVFDDSLILLPPAA